MLDAYALPRSFESEELTTLLLALSPRQRRVLREYVEKVELGCLQVTAWLDEDSCPVTERSWYKANGQYKNCPAFQQALEAYLRAAVKASTAEETRAIARAKRALRLAAAPAAERVVEQVDADLGVFFKVVERWTTEPISTYETLEKRMAPNPFSPEGPEIEEHLQRAVVVDVDRLRDPRFSKAVKKFSDSPRNGIAIELHDAQRAALSILDRADMETAAKGEVEVSDARERLARLLGSGVGGGDQEAAEEPGPGGAGEPE